MYHRVSGRGQQAVYVVASERTMVVAKAMVARHASKTKGSAKARALTLDDAVATLRRGWESYMNNPQDYAANLAVEARAWRVQQARDHLLDDRAFGSNCRHGQWGVRGPTEAQVYVIVEADVLYNAQAFYRIVPRKHFSQSQAKPYLQEQWRDYCANDPWCTDLGFFECQHCSQCSKTGYCEHVATVTMIEEVLPGLPRCMQLKGVGTQGRAATGATKNDRHNTEVPQESPDKMRWSSQENIRKWNRTHH